MKIALVVISLICASASLTQGNVGSQCIKDPKFNVTSFVVSPWPIYYSQQYQISMTGVFLADEYVEQIYIGLKYLVQPFWHYSYQQVRASFSKGETKTFDISVEGPSFIGNYKEQVVLHRSTFSSISCWEFDFTPS